MSKDIFSKFIEESTISEIKQSVNYVGTPTKLDFRESILELSEQGKIKIICGDKDSIMFIVNESTKNYIPNSQKTKFSYGRKNYRYMK